MTNAPIAGSKIAVVTGAARGLGHALSIEFAKRGVQVAAVGRSRESLAELAKHENTMPVVADVSDPAAVATAFEKIDKGLGPVDILINNAAVYPRRDLLDETPDSFADTIATNLGGTFNVTHHALNRMVNRGNGRIINVTSNADRKPAPLSSAYSVSKGATKILTRAIVSDLGDRYPDIVISDWIPGALQTSMGLPDGTPPDVAAKWCVTLALMNERDLNGATFDRAQEVVPMQSWKRRLYAKLSGQQRRPRSLKP